jgi:DNA-binding HxlR family transcriptional regulator
MKQIKRKSDCPINFALEIFGDRWTFLIVRDLMFKGKHFYGEFLLSEEKIATNILADRLSMLESNGIVSKSSDPSHKQKIMYSLTQKGIDLVPVLVEFIIWSAKYDKDSAVDMKFVKNVKRNKVGLISEISSSLVEDLRVRSLAINDSL